MAAEVNQVAAVLGPAWRDLRGSTVSAARAEVRRTSPPHWPRFGLDIIVLAASGVLFWLAGRTGYQIVLAPEGVPTISVSYWAFVRRSLDAPSVDEDGAIIRTCRTAASQTSHRPPGASNNAATKTMITAISLGRPGTAINPADDTFHRRSASRGGRHNRVREDLLRVAVPEHGCLRSSEGGKSDPSWPDPGLPAEPGRARRSFRAGMLGSRSYCFR